MNRTLLLATLLLPCAAQAETWVCSLPTSYGGNYLSTFVRQGENFLYTLTTPAVGVEKSRTLEPTTLEILVENEVFLTLAEIDPDGSEVAVYIIHKEKRQYISDSARFYGDTSRSEGSCVEI
jgi:hypothetical protein